MLVSPAGRDDPGDFFAINLLPVYMNNEEDDWLLNAQTSLPDGTPPLLSSFVNAVQIHQAAIVLEYQRAISNGIPCFF
jgi:hypothetical protein